MEIRNIRWPDEQEAILEHIRLVHGPGDSDLLGKWYGTMPGFDPADCFVIEGDNGEIAAHTMLVPRQMQFGHSVFQASEIGVVGTLETYRGRGYATALMERALERMTERGDALSVLFGIPNFYERWGYEYAVGLYLTSFESSIETELALKAGKWDPSHGHLRRISNQLGIRNRDITVRPFDLNDLPDVMALYAEASALGHSSIARDEQTWAWQLNYMADIGRADSSSFLVAEADDGSLLAYLRLVESAPVNWFRDDSCRFSVIEFAGNDPDATEALLAQAASFARDYAAERIGLYVHPDSRLMTHALARGAALRSFTGAGFLRLNDLSLTLEGLADTLKDRLDRSPYAGQAIRLQLSSERESGEVMLGSGKAEAVPLEAPAADLIRLFSGWFGISNLDSGSHLTKQAPLLQILFPRSDSKVAIADLI